MLPTFFVLMLATGGIGTCSVQSAEPEDLAEMLRFRDWKSTAGTTVKASFVGLKDGQIELKTFERNILVPLSKFSADDQVFVVRLLELQFASNAAELVDLRENLDRAKSDISIKDAAIADSEERLKKLERELQLYKPSAGLDAQDGIPVVTAKRLEIYGQEYKDKTIRMLNCAFINVNNNWVDSLPGVTLRSNGLTSTLDLREKDKWVGFYIHDSEGTFWTYCFASKESTGEFLLSLADGAKIDLEGIVFTRARSGGEVGVLVTKIVKKEDAGPGDETVDR